MLAERSSPTAPLVTESEVAMSSLSQISAPQKYSPLRSTRFRSTTALAAAVLIAGAAAGLSANGLAPITPAYAAESAGPSGFADIVQRVKPAVISVRVRLGEQSQIGGSGGTRVAQGSGFFISADGYAVTNNHVVNR